MSPQPSCDLRVSHISGLSRRAAGMRPDSCWLVWIIEVGRDVTLVTHPETERLIWSPTSRRPRTNAGGANLNGMEFRCEIAPVR
jgi:hypothetical protein